jgi:uroporphyrinogen-III synthase
MALQSVQQYDWLILTSVNGVTAVAERMKHLGISQSSLASLKIAAIGPSTRKEIELFGAHVDVVPDRYVAESVVESLRGRVEGKRVLLARAKVARDVIPTELKKMGAQVDVVEAYQTVTPVSSRKALLAAMASPNSRPHVLTFTSSSTVRNFVGLLGNEFRTTDFAGIQFASIGPITSGTLREVGLPVHIEAAEYTIPALIKAIVAISQKA